MTTRKMVALASLAGVLGLLCATVVTVGPANAYTRIVQTVAGSGTPPPLPTGTVQSSSVTGTVLGGVATASDVDTGRVTFLADVMMTAGVKLHSPRCHWIQGGWWNSGRDVNGRLEWFRDPAPAEVCPSSHSPTGWVKVKGGMTGRTCFNPAKVGMPPGPVVKGRVFIVRSFTNLRIQLHAEAQVLVTAVCGQASASGSATVSFLLKTYIKSSGALKEKMVGNAAGKASANASAHLSCVETPPPVTNTTTTSTTVTQTTSTTTVQTTTTQTTTTTPVQHSCQLTVALASKSDAQTANGTVNGDVAPGSVTWNWGDGNSETAGTSRSHTYATQPTSSTPGTGITYDINAVAHFSNGQNVNCGDVPFFVPAPPPSQTVTQTTTQNGTTTVVTTTTTNTGPPPPPGG